MVQPVPDADAAAGPARFPVLTLRTESAHEEAFVHLPRAAEAGETESMAVIIFPPPESSGRGPSCDFAVPLVPGQFR
jgi:hypothetical protein